MMESCKIGEELLRKFLLGLPPKTLTRFKCVSKWWYTLINNPSFVAKHLSDSAHNKQSTCVFLNRVVPKTISNSTNETRCVFSVLTFGNVVDDADCVHSFLSGVEDVSVPLSMDLNTEDKSIRMVGHCDGIICLTLVDSRKTTFLWNPAIQEFMVLPSETYLPDWYSLEREYMPGLDRLQSTLGFGYDLESKAYKVVNIRFSGSELHADDYVNGYNVVIYPLLVQVYTVGSDSWREIKTYSLETETTYLWPECFQTYYKGMGYWLGNEQPKEFVSVFQTCFDQKEKIRQVILSFDMSGEVFHEVLLPDELNQFNNMELQLQMRLVLWNESIALLSYLGNDAPESGFTSFGVWLMDGTGGAWIKHLLFQLPDDLIVELSLDPACESMALWKSNEILMIALDGGLVCYNLLTKNLKDLPIQSARSYVLRSGDIPDNCFIDRTPLIYVSSMVSLRGDKALEGIEISGI